MNPNETSRRDFLKRFSLISVAIAAAPSVIHAAGATAPSTINAVPDSETPIITLISIMPGTLTEKEAVVNALKSIKGINEVRYDPSFHYVKLSFLTHKNTLPAIVRAARDKGVNVQRLRCDKRAPYCDRQCQRCPAKRNEF